ncbi:MAG: energy-coupled thiamine transporter ThiT [Thermoleophilia bacterium]
MSHSATLPSASAAGGPFAGLHRNADPRLWSVPIIAELGVAVALAVVLSMLRVFTMPQGGSVSLEMVPVIFIAVRRGLVPGLACGAVFGALQLILPGAFIYHPLQAALDYPLAYMAVAAAGLVGVSGVRTLALAVIVGSLARLVCHYFSGLIFFATYAPKWESPWLYALTYNLLYLVPEAAITAVVLWPLLKAYDAAFPGWQR